MILLLLFPLAAWGAESQSIGDLQVFPADNPWQWDISAYAVHPNSDNYINSIGRSTHLHPDFGTLWAGAPNGIPYIVIPLSGPPFRLLLHRSQPAAHGPAVPLKG